MGQDKKEMTVKTGAESRPGFLAATGNFFRDTWAELKKVSWPDAPKVWRSTLVVLLIVLVVGVLVAALDYLFTQGLHFSLDLAKKFK